MTHLQENIDPDWAGDSDWTHMESNERKTRKADATLVLSWHASHKASLKRAIYIHCAVHRQGTAGRNEAIGSYVKQHYCTNKNIFQSLLVKERGVKDVAPPIQEPLYSDQSRQTFIFSSFRSPRFFTLPYPSVLLLFFLLPFPTLPLEHLLL